MIDSCQKDLAALDGRMRAIAACCDFGAQAAAPRSFADVLADATASADAGAGAIEPTAISSVAATPFASGADAARGSATDRELDPIVRRASRESGVDANLLRAVISVESGGNTLARSPAGALGLMQLMPETARGLGVTEPLDAMQNVRGGAAYLRSLLVRFGDPRLAVAAYNAGPAAVERYGGVPPYAETRTYVERVAAELRRLQGDA